MKKLINKKMTENKKIILTDCDGVLLDWETAFHDWMSTHDYELKNPGLYEMDIAYGIEKAECKRLVKEFNESAWMCCLSALRDARSGVNKLVEDGYRFVCITSMSLDPYARQLRIENLEKVFGEGVFLDVICLDTGADKDDALMPYKNTGLWWLEDKTENAVLGADMGLQTILVTHEHNADCDDSRIKKANNWAQIVDFIA